MVDEFQAVRLLAKKRTNGGPFMESTSKHSIYTWQLLLYRRCRSLAEHSCCIVDTVYYRSCVLSLNMISCPKSLHKMAVESLRHNEAEKLAHIRLLLVLTS